MGIHQNARISCDTSGATNRPGPISGMIDAIFPFPFLRIRVG
jgi:hypothetical protein